MFNQVIASVPKLPEHLSSDHDPLFQFHRWKANLRILEESEIKTVPYVPLSRRRRRDGQFATDTLGAARSCRDGWTSSSTIQTSRAVAAA
jgi:hypothetical protein